MTEIEYSRIVALEAVMVAEERTRSAFNALGAMCVEEAIYRDDLKKVMAIFANLRQSMFEAMPPLDES